MEREEIQDLLAMVQAVYPNYNPPSKKAAVNAWLMCMQEYRKEDVLIAFRTYMSTNTSGFAPIPSQLIAILHDLKKPQQLNEMEAWAIVRKALRNCTYDSEEEFEKLPPIVKKSVGTPQQLKTWACDKDFNENVVSSNFIKIYRVEVARYDTLSKIPTSIREMIEGICENSFSNKVLKENKKNCLIRIEEKNDMGTLNEKSSVPMPEKYKKEFNIKD